ncbi:NUDIX hydrolase [uncultured Cohaesibacter sp.]|uniref:NUDIX hydrolase n=1 Tax=uncultured Cohaesibacter sp. TaxID=1002546 RepID=UPI0029307F8F|nr:NUDIX hydrolase [uncultured Cohaesibacter sp.]
MTDRFLPRQDAPNAKFTRCDLKYDGFIKLSSCEMTYRRLDGEQDTVIREIHDHGEAVCVLPVDRERHVAMLVRQLRAGLVYNREQDPMILEVAAGLIDPGETPEQTVLREAEEELGFRINDLQPVAAFYASPGTLTEKIYGFIASYSPADRTHAGGGLAHEGEDIIVEEIALDELGEAVLQGRLRDAKTILLIQHLMLSEPELFF